MNDNALILTAYSSSTTPVTDSQDLLRRATQLTFTTIFPGGVFATLKCFIAVDPTSSIALAAGQRLVARNGLTVCWEGMITSVARISGSAQMGVDINAAGYWGQLLERRGWEKRWADNRLEEAIWPYTAGASGAAKCTTDRSNRMRFTPKGVAWAINNFASQIYTMPTGETVKRVTLSYDMQEAAQAWKLALNNLATFADVWAVTASGTGTRDDTLGTPAQSVEIYFQAAANQTPVEDGTYYGQISGVMVYSEIGTITAQSIAKNIRAKLTELNSDETRIGAPGFTLEPFMSNGREAMASILTRAASYGDGSYNSWAAYLVESDLATTPDGKPVLALTQYPALTSYDYAVRLDDPNLTGELTVVYDLDAVRNWIAVKYRDELNNRDVILTPDDDANLKDTTSITAYGQRETPQPLDASTTSATVAKNLARRYLAAYKDPRLYVSGPIVVKGFIRNATGGRVPASQIRAGMRIRVENYLTDLASVSGAGLTFVITQTDYNDDAQTCSISTGVPDDLAVFLAQLSFRT